jgi:hypothetical protein
MNIYQRPLFRQAGGPIAPEMGPMMPPQGMPPAPMAAPQMMPPQGLDPRAAEAVTQVEQGAAMQAEQYGQNMMAGLDSAETPEEVINAMRGNQRPLEARYGELAEIVGQEDAQRTPETVLALLQPVMMMTEQGAMDSGIGELMGQLTGNIDMMDESGAPTQMGQGVGSLMMAGVGQQPPANFSQGGAVQRFQAGGEASRLQQLYSEMLPVYEGVMGGGEDQKRMMQAQTLFDISDRFGAFAAGIDPRTGERVRGSSAAQLAAAASGLGGQINQRVAAMDQQDRALRVAALQGAAGEFSAERADERAAARAASADRAIGNAYEAVDRETGEVIATEFLATQAQMDAFRAANPGATIRAAVPKDSITDSDFFTKFGFTKEEFYALPIDDQRRLQGLETETPSGEFIKIRMPDGQEVTVRSDSAEADRLTGEGGQRVSITAASDAGITDSDFFTKFGFTKEEFYALPIDDQNRLRGLEAKTPSGEFIKIRMPDGQEVTVRSDSAEADRLTGEGGQRVSITAAKIMETYVNPNNPSKFVYAVVGSPEAMAAEANGMLPVGDATGVFGMLPKPPGEPETLVERQQIAVTDQRTLDNLEKLSSQELSLFAANADAYIQETVSPSGVSSRRSLPPNTQAAMRRAHAEGIDFPGIDPSLFGAMMRPEQVERLGLAILDINNVDLGAATGFVSSLARFGNLLGEQAAEVLGGTGTVFTQTAEASSALNTLASATRRFYIDGRVLAKEFELLVDEIPTYSGFSSDAAARRALTQQRNLLEGSLRRVEEVLDNPTNYTNRDISEARQLKTYADQLLVTYDEFINAYRRLDGGGTDMSYDDIIKNYSLGD